MISARPSRRKPYTEHKKNESPSNEMQAAGLLRRRPVGSSGRRLCPSHEVHDQRADQQHQEDHEEDLRDAGAGAGYAAEAQRAGDDRNQTEKSAPNTARHALQADFDGPVTRSRRTRSSVVPVRESRKIGWRRETAGTEVPAVMRRCDRRSRQRWKSSSVILLVLTTMTASAFESLSVLIFTLPFLNDSLAGLGEVVVADVLELLVAVLVVLGVDRAEVDDVALLAVEVIDLVGVLGLAAGVLEFLEEEGIGIAAAVELVLLVAAVEVVLAATAVEAVLAVAAEQAADKVRAPDWTIPPSSPSPP